MPAQDSTPVGAPCWVDLMTSDTERSRTFYARLLGWAADEPAEEFGGYFNFTKDGVLVAGGMANTPDSGAPDAWSVYLATDDAAKAVDVAGANGGQVVVEPMTVADLGTMAVVTDPGGAMVGMWQPGTHKGFGVHSEPGAPSWFELHTRDYEKVLAFYRAVFGWKTETVSDTAEFRYTTLKHGADWLAGVMDSSGLLPEGVPDHWSVYFGVEDTDAALATTVDLGGSVVRPAEDSPYGRIAEVVDATGAGFKLVAANDAMPARES